MANIIPFSCPAEARKRYKFVNKPVLILQEEKPVQYPCIGLICKETLVPISYPLYERWYLELHKSEGLATATMRKRAIAICAFLNFILWETNCNSLHEVTLNMIREFLIRYKETEVGKRRSNRGWYEGVDAVYLFLANYWEYNKDSFDFQITRDKLFTYRHVIDEESRKRKLVMTYNYLSVKPPKQLKKKNRVLLYEYLDLFLWCCRKYDPDILIGIASQAYAGIREGEVVNLTHNRIILGPASFGRVSKITLDLLAPAPFAQSNNFGFIKKTREQDVYPDFVDSYYQLYQQHVACLEAKGYAVTGEAPLLVDKHGNPMSVTTYSNRVKQLFLAYFMPELKKFSDGEGRWEIDQPYIEAYEAEYPGAHTFRHWYTMYLFRIAKLKPDEISKWRGDSDGNSFKTYLHINADMLQEYADVARDFQRNWLEEIL